MKKIFLVTLLLAGREAAAMDLRTAVALHSGINQNFDGAVSAAEQDKKDEKLKKLRAEFLKSIEASVIRDEKGNLKSNPKYDMEYLVTINTAIKLQSEAQAPEVVIEGIRQMGAIAKKTALAGINQADNLRRIFYVSREFKKVREASLSMLEEVALNTNYPSEENYWGLTIQGDRPAERALESLKSIYRSDSTSKEEKKTVISILTKAAALDTKTGITAYKLLCGIVSEEEIPQKLKDKYKPKGNLRSEG